MLCFRWRIAKVPLVGSRSKVNDVILPVIFGRIEGILKFDNIGYMKFCRNRLGC